MSIVRNIGKTFSSFSRDAMSLGIQWPMIDRLLAVDAVATITDTTVTFTAPSGEIIFQAKAKTGQRKAATKWVNQYNAKVGASV
jgi:hypothetical protein